MTVTKMVRATVKSDENCPMAGFRTYWDGQGIVGVRCYSCQTPRIYGGLQVLRHDG